MIRIAIASGKGGTGKTTFAVNLAHSLEDGVQYIDTDVEAPNGHLFLKPDIKLEKEARVPIPEINKEKCKNCGKCQDACQFNALVVLDNTYMFFPELCHSCGACILACPKGAISETERPIGKIREGEKDGLKFISGILNEGEAKSPPLISIIKEKISQDSIAIVDCPPGSSCPAIEGITDSDYVVLVTEPTPFGLHDLKLAVEMVKVIGIPHGVVINKAGIGDDEVYKYCEKNNIPILMEIPFKKEIARECSKGNLISEKDHRLKEEFIETYRAIIKQLNRRDPR